MKKIIVSILMLFGLFGFSQAAVLDDSVSWMNTNGLTIFKTTKDYQPNNYIRRDEAAKLFVKFAKIVQKDTYKYTTEQCTFSDLNDAHKDLKDIVVESCRMGIFQGANGKFMPRGSLTNEQAIAVLVRIYDGYKSETNVSYRSQNYYKAAETYDIFSKVPMMNERKNTTTRGNVGISIYTVQDLPGNYDEGYFFQSELDVCKGNEDCRNQVMKKYMISKADACKLTDRVHYKPLEISRPNMKVNNISFQRIENMLFYTFDIYTGTYQQYIDLSDFGPTNNRFFSYNCITQESFNVTEKVKSNTNNEARIGSSNIVLQHTDGNLFILGQYYESSAYVLVNLKNGELTYLSDIIDSSKNIEKLKKKYKELFNSEGGNIEIGTEGYEGIYPIINSIDKNMILDLGFKRSGSDGKVILVASSIKIDLINKNIISY